MLMLARTFTIVLGCVGLFLAVACSVTPVQAQMMELCGLVANPPEFDHEAVQVRALVLSDGMHSTVLIDNACPGKGVVLWVPQEASTRPGVVELMDAIYHTGSIGTLGKQITVTVSGEFLSLPESIPSRKLIVESVSDVTVKKD